MRIRTELERPMPLLINDADFNKKLLVIGRNVVHTQDFLDKGTEPFVLPGYVVPDGYTFLKAKNYDQYRLIAKNGDGESITVYAVEIKFHTEFAHPHRSCSQIMVWRTPDPRHDQAVRGLPQRFFEFLLSEHDIVVSDEEQTGAGRRFWQVMLTWAIQSDYNVFIADGTHGSLNDLGWPLYKVASMDEFYEKWDQYAWGNDPEVHKHRRAVISKVILSHRPFKLEDDEE
ncbi:MULTISPECIES: hypothetical protein [Citrobacter]|uniref:hypothetical protein n=1 Tax=Citrobacter TaxID=544 RepID=UPI0021119111|nr:MULTISPECIES: hypothetical protein [Citrobacter]MCQ6311663.1 hypothetical protein [Citrobacter portucalensis]MDC8910595.1 hypothetical protein [Citrobacter freundii]MDM2902775.1 hypothetical protein [Citrobacter sp. Cpo037]MDM3343780.1 hypothetical protein [Citrobacter sp. Cf115]